MRLDCAGKSMNWSELIRFLLDDGGLCVECPCFKGGFFWRRCTFTLNDGGHLEGWVLLEGDEPTPRDAIFRDADLYYVQDLVESSSDDQVKRWLLPYSFALH